MCGLAPFWKALDLPGELRDGHNLNVISRETDHPCVQLSKLFVSSSKEMVEK
jgi:hypothetical protein